MAKILIADDMVTVQHNLSTILSSYDHEIVGKASNCSEAIEMVIDRKPEIVLLDILGMKSFYEEEGRDIDTFDTISIMLKKKSDIKIIILTASPKENYIKKALVLGAKGFLVKGVNNEKIDETIRSVLK